MKVKNEKFINTFANEEIADMIEDIVKKIHNIALSQSFSKVDETEDEKDMKLIFAEYLFNSQSLLLQVIEKMIYTNNKMVFEWLRKLGDESDG